MTKYFKTLSENYKRIFFFLGISLLTSELWKQWYLTVLINDGRYQWWYFPFQLCSIAMYILLLLPRVTNVRLHSALLTFLMCYSLLGGIVVFVDTSGLQYPSTALTLHSYLWHIILIFVGISAGIVNIKILCTTQRKLQKHLFGDSTLVYLGCCVIASFINVTASKYGLINMFYINPKYKMQQIGFSSLVGILGNTGAIFCYITATILGAGILFFVWCRIYRHYYSYNNI